MAQNKTNTAAQVEEATVINTATPQNHERVVKTPKQRSEGVANAKKRAEATAAAPRKALKSGAKTLGNGTKSIAREIVADAAGGAIGIVTTMAVGNLVNGALCSAINIADNEIGKRNPRMVTVKKSFGRRKTMTEDKYFRALSKGKKFKEVETNHFILDHKQTIDTAVGVTSYAMGAGVGVAAGTTTRKVVKGQLGYTDRKQQEALDLITRTLRGDDFTENGQV
nr:MAG TPA: hypothetical protein [Caudoviricetes sp.]